MTTSGFDLPMFPLGTVLVPGMLLPLHVFEAHYRLLVTDVLTTDGRFGVVLIERGHEVGGGDTRVAVGTIATIVDHRQLPDGRHLLMARGTDRIRVLEWLEESPEESEDITNPPKSYPRAHVKILQDEAQGDHERNDPEETAHEETIRQLAHEISRLQTEHADKVGISQSMVDPLAEAWQTAVMAGVGPLDLVELLGMVSPAARRRLCDQLQARRDVLAFMQGKHS